LSLTFDGRKQHREHATTYAETFLQVCRKVHSAMNVSQSPKPVPHYSTAAKAAQVAGLKQNRTEDTVVADLQQRLSQEWERKSVAKAGAAVGVSGRSVAPSTNAIDDFGGKIRLEIQDGPGP